MHTHRFRLSLLALMLCAAAWAGTAPARSATPIVVKPTQTLAMLLSAHEAFSRTASGSKRLVMVQARRPITGERTVLPVIGRRSDAVGARWLRVRLPGRPNGRTAWIRQRGTVASTTSWHIVVDTAARRVFAYRNGRPVRIFEAVVGKPSTPTPGGAFFVEESVQLKATDPGAPFALALSARSTVLREFEGGPGQIAIHGTANIGGALGTAVSHGCVRLDTEAMRWLVARIGPGVPVTITR